MVKKILGFVMILTIVFVLPAATPIEKNATDNSVEIQSSVFDVNYENVEIASNVIKARFENMLANNYVYDLDFQSDKTIIENSILALLDKGIDGEIDKDLVLGFIFDMYGLRVDPEACKYEFAPASEGMFVILPRGYTEYEHKIMSVTEKDDVYTVVSSVFVSTHDGEQYITTATTKFVSNVESSFGYNIVDSSLF